MNSPEETPHDSDRGLDKIAAHGRVEYRLIGDNAEITPEIRQQIIEDIQAYRDDNGTASQPLSWGRLGELIGISQGTLVTVVRGTYTGDTDGVLRKIDQFLADDRARVGRFDFRTHARISITEAIFGAIRSGIRLNTMPVIIAESGDGKSVHARAFAADRGGVILIRPDEKNGDACGITLLICNAVSALHQFIQQSHRRRLDAIQALAVPAWLGRHRGR